MTDEELHDHASVDGTRISSTTEQLVRYYGLFAVLVLLVALAIRVIGIRGTLPYLYHPDESANLVVIHRMVVGRTANPHFFDYPSLFFDIQAAVHAGYVHIGSAVGWSPSAGAVRMPAEQTYGNSLMRDSSTLVLARVVTVVMGVTLVAASMWLCWLLSRKRAATLVAGLLVALHPILVRNARWLAPDTLAGLTTTAAVITAVFVARDPRARNYVFAGLTVGLAVSSKYNTVVVVVALLTAHVITHRRPTQDATKLLVAGLVAVIVFVVTTPFVLLDWHEFWQGVTFEVRHYQTGHLGAQGDSLRTNLRWMWDSTGPLLLLPLGALLSQTKRRLLVVPLVFIGAYVALLAVQQVRFERNLVPLLPVLLVVAAIVGSDLLVRAFGRGHPVLFRPSIIALVLMVAWPGAGALQDAIASTGDDRASARSWIERNMPAQSKIVVDGYGPYVDPTRYRVTPIGFNSTLGPWIEPLSPDAVIVTAAWSGRFLTARSKRRSIAEALAWLERSSCAVETFNRGAHSIQVFRLECPPSPVRA